MSTALTLTKGRQWLEPVSADSGTAIPRWVLVALPSAAFGTAVLVYLKRRTIIDWVYDRLALRGDDPGKAYLTGNYGPVSGEVSDSQLAVIQGALPKELQGAYIRTGPNPEFKPVGAYHWFDGDGMLHAVRIKGQKAQYANRYVLTSRLQQERAAGKALFTKLGDICGKQGLLLLVLSQLKKLFGVINVDEGTGTGNTALVFHARKLLALHEGDLPYQVRVLCDGVVETLGRLKMKDAQSGAYPGPFTAHPKVDPKTGEMFFFGYSFDSKPYLRGGLMSKAGELLKQWAIDCPWPVMAHDCAMTANYAVLLHLPLCFDPEVMVKNNTLPLVFRPDRPARIGLLRKDAPGCDCDVTSPAAKPAPVQWFELPAFFAFHVGNAWEDAKGCVHIHACHFKRFTFGFNDKTKTVPPEEERQTPYEYILDPKTGASSIRQTSSVNCDFPVVNPHFACYPTKYMWGATWDYSVMTVEATGIAKYDLTMASGKDSCVAQIRYPPGCYGGEAFFTPRHEDPAKCRGEDDGFLLVYVYNTEKDSSTLQVFDAKTMNNTPIATVQMPRRIPYGFHSTFVTEGQLQAQAPALVA